MQTRQRCAWWKLVLVPMKEGKLYTHLKVGTSQYQIWTNNDVWYLGELQTFVEIIFAEAALRIGEIIRTNSSGYSHIFLLPFSFCQLTHESQFATSLINLTINHRTSSAIIWVGINRTFDYYFHFRCWIPNISLSYTVSDIIRFFIVSRKWLHVVISSGERRN